MGWGRLPFEDPIFDPPYFTEDEKSWVNQAITMTTNQQT
ncbi:uncharacterized protein MP3633_1117 [Marinomonas primoryensis]|uniref:Uncharacterized protein n=1 Tax=Marinomonas primoryensis TaxID=178399 RepID=A0A859CV23_9GAMM|nr:uncharacterized protein MP3633_1117 [Marinomonas primoryensis]